ncbi:hypothetical protein GOP47_0016076, partial [Adiantum capillus-veneris]
MVNASAVDAASSLRASPSLNGRNTRFRPVSAEELKDIRLPTLASSFSSELHPQYEEVKTACDEWIERVAELPSAAARCFLRDCLLPLLICRLIPRALPGKRLLQAIKLVAWLMISDDDDDDPQVLGSDYVATCHRSYCLLTILTQPANAFIDGRLWNYHLLDRRLSNQLANLADLWRPVSPDMSPLLRSRFISSMADYLEGIKVKKEDHEILYWVFHRTNIPEVIDRQTNQGEVLRLDGRGDFQVQWHLAGDIHKTIHFFISYDKQHDTHFVQHCFLKHAEWLKQFGLNIRRQWVWSDGAASQFKARRPFYFLTRIWTFMESFSLSLFKSSTIINTNSDWRR